MRTTPGPHEVRLSLDGYVPRVTRPVLPPDRDFELRIAVVLTPVRGGELRRAPTADDLFKAQVAAAHACSLKGDLECALSGYRSAYKQRPHPLILFNIAQLRRKLGQYGEAATNYREFLAQAEKPKGGAAPQKELIAEARLQLANCENRMVPKLASAPAAVTPAPSLSLPVAEDTTPPRLQHVPILTARRSLPLRLVATITDDRSGVGLARACWRNAYERDFECHPLGNIGGTEYGIEVPARALTDYFAYYLEAYDNAENGPARSGAPELPHAVTVDDPPQAVVTPGARVAVATPPSGEPQFAALPYPPMVVQQPPPGGRRSPYDASAPSPGQSPWNLTLLLGGERSHEDFTDSVVQGRIGLEGTYRFAGNWMAVASGDWRSSNQQYAPLNAPPGSRTTVDENRFDFSGMAGYDFGDLLGVGDRLELIPVAGFQGIFARNDGFPFNVVGPSAGLRASYTFAPFTVLAVGSYTYNLDKNSGASSSAGSAKSAWGLRAGLQFRLGTAYTVELDYVGDGIVFENDVRVGHGAVLGFSKAF